MSAGSSIGSAAAEPVSSAAAVDSAWTPWRRLSAVVAAAWRARQRLAPPQRMADERAFLPAALSLQETPPHPAPRRAAAAICALFAVAVAWAVVGQVDIVAVANGRIVVSERSKIVQPLDAGIVKRVLVKDGDTVRAGQVLVELDGTAASADGTSIREQWKVAHGDEYRAAVLIEALESGRTAPASLARSSERTGDPAAEALIRSEWLDISARLMKLRAEQTRREAEIGTVRHTIAKLEATLPIARRREADIDTLARQGFVAGHAVQDRTRERIEQERDLATQTARLVEAQAALVESIQARTSYLAETRRALSERQVQAGLRRQQLEQERSKAEQRSRLMQLTAPTAGTVQQLAVHTEGGVVTPAQVLMVIVPRDAPVTAEVVIENRDIGFVRAGQAAQIKLETFPYTHYGTVAATVRSVAADAVNDERRGAIFPAVLALANNGIEIDGRRINLGPGMNVTAEIKTGRRRVIEYLLSPVQRTVHESLGER